MNGQALSHGCFACHRSGRTCGGGAVYERRMIGARIAVGVAVQGGQWAETENRDQGRGLSGVVAEGVGFEPTMSLHPYRFSRPAHSTTLPPLHRVYGAWSVARRGD